MDRNKAYKNTIEYLSCNGQYFINTPSEESLQLYLIYKGCKNCPNKRLESSITFNETHIEARVYFDETAAKWCKKSPHKVDLMRLINFINASAWVGLKTENEHWYPSRLYMFEDTFDITLTTVISYDIFEMLETEPLVYLTEFCPRFMNFLSPAIYGLILGSFDLKMAKLYIEDIKYCF